MTIEKYPHPLPNLLITQNGEPQVAPQSLHDSGESFENVIDDHWIVLCQRSEDGGHDRRGGEYGLLELLQGGVGGVGGGEWWWVEEGEDEGEEDCSDVRVRENFVTSRWGLSSGVEHSRYVLSVRILADQTQSCTGKEMRYRQQKVCYAPLDPNPPIPKSPSSSSLHPPLPSHHPKPPRVHSETSTPRR